MSLHWKIHTNFPFTRVFVLGIILFFLGLACMIISIIAFVSESWGHYVATGMWGGASILASGSTAIFASRLRSLASVKTLLICSVITCFTSLTMLILSAGGLSLNSGFYTRVDPSDYNKRTSNLIHASLLVISVFCLSGNVLAVTVCCKYLFFEQYDKSKHRRRQRHLPEGTIRVSTSLRGGASNSSSGRTSNVRPHQLHINDNPTRRHSDNAGVNRVQIEYRRAHRRSASDQPYSQQLNQVHSPSRRNRHSHQDNSQFSSNPHNSSSRHRQGRYLPPSRALYHEKPSKSESDSERVNSGSGRYNLSTRARSNQATLQIRMAPCRRSSNPQQVRLPTDFDEEELPPYEPSDSTQPQSGLGCSDCDSGDESDTENSSSSDAQSYDAVELCVEGAEAVPMVNLRHQRIYRNRRRDEQTTHFTCSPPVTILSEVDDSRPRNSVRRSRTFDFNDIQSRQAKQRRSMHSNSDQALSLTNPQIDPLGEYECLISVSPEICAITGESSVVAPENEKIPHVVHENPYENGPCYENVQAVGIQSGDSHLNPLSKSYKSTVEQRVRSSSASAYEHKVAASPVAARIEPVRLVNRSSRLSNDSPVSVRSSFGSPNSAFRPVKPPSQPMSPHNINFSAANSPHQESNNNLGGHQPIMCTSPLDNNTHSPAHQSDSSAQLSTSDGVNTCFNQGAIPKANKQASIGVQNEENPSLSWKNIPLPLSYNHSESASNDEEKKLPSKRIPYAESNENFKRKQTTSGTHEKKDQRTQSPSSHKKSKCSSSSSASSHLSSLSSSYVRHPISSENQSTSISSQMVSSAPALSFSTENSVPPRTKDRTLITTQPLSPPTQTSSSLSSLALASLQESFLRSHPSQQRMGGNQSLLQSRRDELRNVHLNQRSGRWPRPSSLLDDRQLHSDNKIPLSLVSPALSVDRETTWSTADREHPLSLSSYLMGQPTAQSHQRRQALNSHQHHVPQPQQPRLGVQLQRRPHHVMMSGNDQFQEHNQHQHPQFHPRQLPQPHPPQQVAGVQQEQDERVRRTNRPLFSVLL